MPCYDKKLEASRDDFVFQLESHFDEGREGEANMISEVDSVLTTGEILELIQVRNLYAYLHFYHTLLLADVYIKSCLGSIF
jgi:iron only hydrogenase large subunit-like protein